MTSQLSRKILVMEEDKCRKRLAVGQPRTLQGWKLTFSSALKHLSDPFFGEFSGGELAEKFYQRYPARDKVEALLLFRPRAAVRLALLVLGGWSIRLALLV